MVVFPPLPLFPQTDPPADLLALETALYSSGYQAVAGVDEAGRGPLAGPVVAAAVILDRSLEYPGVNDSKKITPNLRNRLFDLIQTRAISVGVGLVESADIDRINILTASLQAMVQAVQNLSVPPDYLLIDGPYPTPCHIPQKPVTHGDSLSLSIGAASIIAKVTRDRLMMEYDRLFPNYGFAKHKGYPTKAHIEALNRFGPCPIHRRTYRPVAECGQPRFQSGTTI
ncbi:MAG: ribonuclease HII [Deltaproteobacteria bacterium]|nr:ribonuclease HII [Deltaproteobacteria bacterium]